ncbi:MAG: urease accessory protein UreJ [Leptolyngbya sp. DLM2.Bin15]|nr:MAG: urease accessory protein UreJ [Leptolyngbya sp. DLM2.Bin15]
MTTVQRPVRAVIILALALGAIALYAAPALAHHPLGGETPTTFIAGFLSGLGHPIIGLDHAAFVVASGLLATLWTAGLAIPLAFVLSSLLGTGVHLLGWDLPAAEIFISGSVVLFGVLLALRQQLPFIPVVSLGAIAGLFHGYAYGEAIIGAEMMPLVAYLLGFTVIQGAIALAAYAIARRVGLPSKERPLSLRFAGFLICGLGTAFLSAIVLG